MISPRDLFLRFEAAADTREILVRDDEEGIALSGWTLRERVGLAESGLRDVGISRGDLVLLSGLSGVGFVSGILGVWACDAVAVAADPQLLPREIEGLRKAFSPGIVIRQRRGDLAASRGRSGPSPILPPGAAVVKLSSGSTGRPRGIAVTAGQLVCDAEQLLRGMGITREDVNIAVVPLSHSYGLGSLVMPMVVQGNRLLLSAPLPETLSRALSTGESAVFPGIPTLYDLLARSGGAPFRPGGLRICLSAGALLRSSTARAFREKFGLPVRVLYGASETGGITYDASSPGDAGERWEGCVGTPLPGVEIALEGEEGRVVVRGENVAWGYVGEAGKESDGEFAGGAFRTGDTGRFDSEGRLLLTGRIGNLVNVSGRKVNPSEVEQALLSLEEVADAAVLGIPDASRGESLLACVVLKGEITRERVMLHLRERVASYKLPRRLLFLPELPRNARGKLDRLRVLRRAGIGRG
jgi:long-chain acyl-CoA synthetase